MKSISKAMIAVLVAAAMCVVPLFVIEDADAADIDAKKGASFKAGSIGDDDFNAFVSDGYKQYLAYGTIDIIVSGDSDAWVITDIVVKNVKNVKLSKGNEATETGGSNVEASAITFDIAFKAKYVGLLPITLFSKTDGTQALYKAFGDRNTIVTNDTLEVDGTVTMEESKIVDVDYQKVDSGKYVITKTVTKSYTKQSFDGSYIFKEKKVTYEESKEMSYVINSVAEFDDKIAEVTSTTKAFLTSTIDSGGVVSKIKYKVGDDSNTISDEIGNKDELGLLISMFVNLGYERNEAGLLGLVTDSASITGEIVPYVIYDATDEDVALFTNGMLATAYQSNDECLKFLNDKGTTSTEFSEAKSVADSAYSNVSVGGSSGGSNVIFYVIIGVLAVAVVALAVLLIKKK